MSEINLPANDPLLKVYLKALENQIEQLKAENERLEQDLETELKYTKDLLEEREFTKAERDALREPLEKVLSWARKTNKEQDQHLAYLIDKIEVIMVNWQPKEQGE